MTKGIYPKGWLRKEKLDEIISGRVVDEVTGDTVMEMKPANIEMSFDKKMELVGAKMHEMVMGVDLANGVENIWVAAYGEDKSVSMDIKNSPVREEIEIQTSGPVERRIFEVSIDPPKSFSKIFKGDLTQDEIKMLPLELKVCWMLQDWNKGFAPRSIEEWAKGIGFLAFKHYEYGDNDYDIQKSVRDAINTAKSTISFIKDYMMNPVIDNKESDYITELEKHFDDGKPMNEQTRYNW